MKDLVNMSDHTGHWPQWTKNAISAVGSAVKKIFSQNVADKLSIYHNKVFIRRMRKLGAIIFDNGPRWSKNATSKWYIMEKQVLKGYSRLIKMY